MVFTRFSLNKGLPISAVTALVFFVTPSEIQALATQITVKPDSSSGSEFNPRLSEADYVLGAGDRIYIDIFQEEDYTGEYLVLVDGTVSLPLAGKVQVEGQTLQKATQTISERYARYLRLPVVTVSLVAPRPITIAISGEVRNPGAYTVSLGDDRKFPSVVDIVQQAGGITTAADVRQVQIQRSAQGQNQLMTVDLWQLLQQGNLKDNIALRDGDTIIVPTKDKIDVTETRQLAAANFGIQTNEPVDVAVVGEVYRPGSYQVNPEQSNAEGNRAQPPKLSKAIEQAGGIKPLANIRNIEVRRQTRSGSQQTIDIDLWALLQDGDLSQDVILQDGDTILIPTAQTLDPTESETLATASFSPGNIQVNVVGEVEQPGRVELSPNTPLNQALLAAGGFDDERAKKSSVELIRLNPDGTVAKRDIKIDFASSINEENNPTLRNNDVVVVKRSDVAAASDGLSPVLNTLGAIFSPINFLLRLF
ncbi:MAG: SLBB domain-containing protein [Cyanophyceae cyanobacterium]